MGCTQSCSGGNKADLQIVRAQEAEKHHFKVLLLGAGESGKSTFSKQLKLLNKGVISENDKLMYRKALRRNLVECMQTLLNAGEAMRIPLGDSGLRKAADRVRNSDLLSRDITPSLGRDVASLWEDAGVQKIWSLKHKFWSLDSTPYYMKESQRISDDAFEATEEDILMSRVITTGVGTIEVKEPPYRFSVVDVGGQRNERKKWLHCFDDVKGIVFLISLAGYNQVMFEDSDRNRLMEALDLYEQVVSDPMFKDAPIHVLLNKLDLFEEMIKEVPLSTCFKEYDGPDDAALPAISFIKEKCRTILEQYCPHKKCAIVPMCARRRQDVRSAWTVITDTIREHAGLENDNR